MGRHQHLDPKIHNHTGSQLSSELLQGPHTSGLASETEKRGSRALAHGKRCVSGWDVAHGRKLSSWTEGNLQAKTQGNTYLSFHH